MPFSPDHADMTRTVAAQRGAHNPYGQASEPDGLGDPPPEIFRRIMNAWKTGESVTQIQADWKAQRASNQRFNAVLRGDALAGTFEVDADEVLGREEPAPQQSQREESA